MNDKKKRLQKLRALAMHGVDGEKDAANAILDKLMEKYGYSMEDLDAENIQEYAIKYKGEQERCLLIQIAYKVMGDTKSLFCYRYTCSGRKCGNQLGINCTAAQKEEIEFLFDFHKRLWKQECNMLLLAYIQKHTLYGQLKDGKTPTMTEEEERKVRAFVNGLSDSQPLKLLTEGSGG